MKKIFIFLAVAASLFNSLELVAQPFIAGGRIYLDAVDPNATDCNGPFVYNVDMAILSDAGLDPIPATLDINYYRASDPTFTPVVVTLNATDPEFNPDNRCIFGGIVSTLRYFSGTITLPSAQNDWVVAYGDKTTGATGYTPTSENLDGPQPVYFDTELDNTCEILTVGTVTRINNGRNRSTRLVNDEPLETFCSDRDYEFTLLTTDQDVLPGSSVKQDSINFKIVPLEQNRNNSVQYFSLNNPPFSSFYPFPMKPGTQGLQLNSATGRLKFTPLLEPGKGEFVSIIGLQIIEFRNKWEILNTPSGDQFSPIRVPICTTNYVMRFVIGPNCDPNVPYFVAENEWNPTASELASLGGVPANTVFDPSNPNKQLWNYYEFDCGVSRLPFRLTAGPNNTVDPEPYLYSSLVPSHLIAGGSDFRLTRALEDANPYPINSVVPYASQPLSSEYQVANTLGLNGANVPGLNAYTEFEALRVELQNSIGPGLYYLTSKLGADGNTIENRCASGILPLDTIAGIYINDNLEYIFPGNDEVFEFCWPEDTVYSADFLTTSFSNTDAIESNYTNWIANDQIEFLSLQYPFPSNARIDSIKRDNFANYPNTIGAGVYEMRIDTALDRTSNPPDTAYGEGVWEAGIGIRFPYFDLSKNLVTPVPVCVANDIFNVDIFLNPTFEVEDYDLCPNEPWPVINLDTLIPKGAVNYEWEIADQIPGDYEIGSSKSLEKSGQSTGINWIPVGGTNDPSLEVSSFAAEIGRKYLVKAIVTFNPAGCEVEEEFTVIRQRVDAEIGESDVICDGEQYQFGSLVDYELPDQMSYRWLLNGNEVPGETDNGSMITYSVTGLYQLEVTKNTSAGACKDTAEVYTVVNPLLELPQITCEEVTFEDGQIKQVFRVQPLFGADTFEVQELYADSSRGGWVEINGDDGVTHTTFGPQISLEVRGVNKTVEEDAVCRFSDVASAEPCEIIVKSTNVFTPNGDGINDLLRFDLIEVYPESKLQIFNRWGEMVYESASYQNDWDGGDQKEGTYFYVLLINDPDNINPELFKGTITLIR